MVNKLDFLAQVAPFNLLAQNVLQTVADSVHEIYHNKESVIYRQESTVMKGVDILVEGEYESFFYDSNQNKRLEEHHHATSIYGGISILLNRKKSLNTVIAKKGTLVYNLPENVFRNLCQQYDAFLHFFTAEFSKKMLNDEFAHFFKRPEAFEESYVATDQLYSKKIENVEYRAIVSCTSETPIAEAACIMARNRISCLFVKNDTNNIIGYVTDITLRDKVIATGFDVNNSIVSVMAKPVLSINVDAFVYEAVLMMFSTKARYLLVEKDGNYIGFLSRNKLLSEEAESPLNFIQSVKLALSKDELKRKWEEVPFIVSQLLDRGVNAEIVNQLITSVADTIAIKVIEDTIANIGEPPAKFVFMIMGSEGRKEQTLKTDQDNAIIYEDKANEHREEVREYFLQFAEAVSDKLNYIGFVFCSGGFMAKNPKWTHSLSHWKRNYESWINESEQETVMKFATFFDCRYLYGEATLMEELKDFMDEALQKPHLDMFFNRLTTNALQYEPPLTFFKKIRTTTRGQQEVFDIKKAMTPIVDLVRVYALRNRIFAVNTGERLKALNEKYVFTDEAFKELLQSYYLLMRLRLRTQAREIIYDKMLPDNYINMAALTKIEKVTLKEIFKTIKDFQSFIKIRFTNNLLG
jgi:CBS domain-containing protein